MIQVGRLGDILICLPIARFYEEKGYDVHWPVVAEYVDVFDNIDYVTPIKLKGTVWNATSEAYSLASDFDKVLDLSFGFPDSDINRYLNDFNFATNFVEAKYKLANVPLEERWTLSFKRNIEKEDKLKEYLIKNENYALIHAEPSSEAKLTNQEKLSALLNSNDTVEVKRINGFNIFDWYKVIEEAKKIYCIDSSFCNLIEAVTHFKFKEKYFLPFKESVENMPWMKTTLKNNWIVYD